jgi:hypothetical protein
LKQQKKSKKNPDLDRREEAAVFYLAVCPLSWHTWKRGPVVRIGCADLQTKLSSVVGVVHSNEDLYLTTLSSKAASRRFGSRNPHINIFCEAVNLRSACRNFGYFHSQNSNYIPTTYNRRILFSRSFSVDTSAYPPTTYVCPRNCSCHLCGPDTL